MSPPKPWAAHKPTDRQGQNELPCWEFTFPNNPCGIIHGTSALFSRTPLLWIVVNLFILETSNMIFLDQLLLYLQGCFSSYKFPKWNFWRWAGTSRSSQHPRPRGIRFINWHMKALADSKHKTCTPHRSQAGETRWDGEGPVGMESSKLRHWEHWAFPSSSGVILVCLNRCQLHILLMPNSPKPHIPSNL